MNFICKQVTRMFSFELMKIADEINYTNAT